MKRNYYLKTLKDVNIVKTKQFKFLSKKKETIKTNGLTKLLLFSNSINKQKLKENTDFSYEY